MTPDDKGCLVFGATNYAWLKAYMAPVREHVERNNALHDTRTELLDLKRENQELKQLVDRLSHKNRAAFRLFRRNLA